MKMSMHILADWLKDYNPNIIISHGKMEIEKYMMLPCEMPISDSSLYIGRISDVFPHIPSSEVVLVHKNDVISLKTTDLPDIFNAVSRAFSFYNNWESQLIQGASSIDPEQKLIDACEGILGPMMLIDMELETIAISKYPSAGSVNRVFDELTEKGHASTDIIRSINDGFFLSNYTKKFECKIHHDKRVGRYEYATICSYCSDDGDLLGHLLILSEDKPGTMDLQLSEVLLKKFNSIRYKPDKTARNSFVPSCLKYLLEHELSDEYKLSVLLEVYGWKPDDSYCVVNFKCSSVLLVSQSGLIAKRISSMIDSSIVVQVDECFYCCINLLAMRGYSGEVAKVCSQLDLYAGVSLTSRGLRELHYQKKQADEAVKRAMHFKEKVLSFYKCALDSILLTENMSYKSICIHPGIDVLREYDAANGTDLLNTLKIYLRSERSPLITSQIIGTHKNTIINRMEKIINMLGISFDVPYDREYMLCSLRLFELNMEALIAACDGSTIMP